MSDSPPTVGGVRLAFVRSPAGADDVLDILQELLDDRSALTRRLLGQPPGVGSERGGLEAPPSMFRALAASGLPLPPDVLPAG